jgi:hypothetical protein
LKLAEAFVVFIRVPEYDEIVRASAEEELAMDDIEKFYTVLALCHG